MSNTVYNLQEYGIDTTTEPHIIINSDRTVNVPTILTNIAVQYDHNIETVTFDCPRYWDGHDMFAMNIYISYQRADGFIGCYDVTDAEIDKQNTNIIHFTWTISNQVTAVCGSLSFSINIKKIDKSTGKEIQHWGSQVNNAMKILAGLKCDSETNLSV